MSKPLLFEVHYTTVHKCTVEADSLANAEVVARRKITSLWGPLAKVLRVIAGGVERGNAIDIPKLPDIDMGGTLKGKA